jgi:hypothetical protein
MACQRVALSRKLNGMNAAHQLKATMRSATGCGQLAYWLNGVMAAAHVAASVNRGWRIAGKLGGVMPLAAACACMCENMWRWLMLRK